MVLSGRELNALVRGGGMQVLSGTTLYPNEDFWDEVLPDDPGLWSDSPELRSGRTILRRIR